MTQSGFPRVQQRKNKVDQTNRFLDVFSVLLICVFLFVKYVFNFLYVLFLL